MSSLEKLEHLKKLASEAIAASQFESAQKHYVQALALDDDNPDVHYGLATCCFVLGDLVGASEHFQEVCRLDPLRAGAYVNLGAVYNRLGRYDDAVTTLRKGIQLDQKRGEGYYNLGIVHRNMGHLDLAIQAYREATRINPRMADAHYNLANVYMEQQNLGQAAVHYREALAIRPAWEKARAGAEACVEAQRLAAEERANESSHEHASAPSTAASDQNRLIDPNIHSEELKELHQYIVELQVESGTIYEIAHKEIEHVLRDLSNALLFPSNTKAQLSGQIDKLDLLVKKLNAHHEQLTNRLKRCADAEEMLMSK